MLPLRLQRMFRAHIRCDRWCHPFCLGKIEIPLITQWTLRGSQYFWSDKQINTLNALLCCVHTWEFCVEGSYSKCERKHNLSSWVQKVALKKIRINKEACAAISDISLKATPPPCGSYGYCILNSWELKPTTTQLYVFLFVCLKRIKSNTSSFVFLCF